MDGDTLILDYLILDDDPLNGSGLDLFVLLVRICMSVLLPITPVHFPLTFAWRIEGGGPAAFGRQAIGVAFLA